MGKAIFGLPEESGKPLGTAFVGVAVVGTLLKKYFTRQPVGREAHGSLREFYLSSIRMKLTTRFSLGVSCANVSGRQLNTTLISLLEYMIEP